MTTHETCPDTASSEGTITAGTTGSSPTSRGRLATTQAHHPTICYWPRSGHVPL
jgi:hypothetical protein